MGVVKYDRLRDGIDHYTEGDEEQTSMPGPSYAGRWKRWTPISKSKIGTVYTKKFCYPARRKREETKETERIQTKSW